MLKVLWGIIGIWSMFAELIVFYDYLRWRPEKTGNLGTAVKNVFLYRLKMMDKSRVQLMTPFMKEPLVGMINSSMDGNGCWYHFFYPDDTGEMIDEYLDLSYHMFGLGLELSVFDWISSSKK